jgi:hypothetical protein
LLARCRFERAVAKILQVRFLAAQSTLNQEG